MRQLWRSRVGLAGLAVFVLLPAGPVPIALAAPDDESDAGQVTVVPGDQLGWHESPRVRMEAQYSRGSSGSGDASGASPTQTSGGSAGSGGGSGPACTYEPITQFAGETNHPRTADALHQLVPELYLGSRGGDESQAFRVSCGGAGGGWVVGDGAGGPGAPGGAGPTVVLPTPGELAERARRQLVLPLPAPGLSPKMRLDDGREATLVNENTWVWTDPGVWGERTERVRVGPVWAEVTARPKRMRFDSGMRQRVTCDGPGTPYDRSYGMHAASPDCGLVYGRSSEGMPNGETRAEYAITWSVSWRGSTGATDEGGELPDMISRASESFVVAEAQSLRAS